MPILAIIQVVGKYWQLMAGIALAGVCFTYGYGMASDKCVSDNAAAAAAYQEKANEASLQFENAKATNDRNKRKIYHAKSNNFTCNVTADQLRIINSALTNDTSKLN